VPHVTDGMLRRLEDEPLSVPDRATDHVEGCARCRSRLGAVTGDADRCRRVFSAPQLVPDLDAAWTRLVGGLSGRTERPDRSRVRISLPRRPHRLLGIPARASALVGVVAVVLAGTATAATLTTTVFAPTHVAPLPLARGDLEALAGFMGLGEGHVLGGFSTSSGTIPNSFGTITWSSLGTARSVPTLAEASQDAGFAVPVPSSLPPGVGTPQSFVVQSRVNVSVTFDASDPQVGGSSVTLDAGPAVVVEYGSEATAAVPTLAILAMPRPTAVSTGATTSQIEAFLLSQPHVPPALSEEIRLVGDIGTTLPVPVPSGAAVHSVLVGGSPGVLVSDASEAVGAIVWEDSSGMLHVVAGLLDQHDLLNVADQLG
jgi:hypothetical protein